MGFLPSSAAVFIYLFKTAIRHRASPKFIGSRNCVPMAFTDESQPHRASKHQGSSERVLPWQVTMDQLLYASLSHTHCWYEVGIYYVIMFFKRLRRPAIIRYNHHHHATAVKDIAFNSKKLFKSQQARSKMRTNQQSVASNV